MPVVRRSISAFAALGALALAGPAAAKTIDIGLPDGKPLRQASCPQNCFAIDKLTGYQSHLGKYGNPMKVPRKGNIVAFTIALGKPTAKQSAIFKQRFGDRPMARIAILKPGKRNRQKLVAQSETFDLSSYLGSRPQFPLARSLPVVPGEQVALTVPTWAPAFAVNLGNGAAWRSSRKSSGCLDFNTPAMQQTLNTTLFYNCVYKTAQLLYTATLIPDPPTVKQSTK
jgi:hypothetical protein